ncbi:hypothetical protein BZY52_26105, partial [Enterobacter hormaechei]
HTSIEHSRDWCRSLLILNCQELAAQQPLRPINWCSRLLKMTDETQTNARRRATGSRLALGQRRFRHPNGQFQRQGDFGPVAGLQLRPRPLAVSFHLRSQRQGVGVLELLPVKWHPGYGQPLRHGPFLAVLAD